MNKILEAKERLHELAEMRKAEMDRMMREIEELKVKIEEEPIEPKDDILNELREKLKGLKIK